MSGFKIVDLDGNAMYYFETKVEAEKFIHDLNLVDGFRIEEVNPEKKIKECDII